MTFGKLRKFYGIPEAVRQLAHQDAPANLNSNSEHWQRFCSYYSYLLLDSFADFAETESRCMEWHNVHLAWHWALAQQKYELLDRMVNGMERLYADYGYAREGEALFAQSLAAVTEHEPQSKQPQNALISTVQQNIEEALERFRGVSSG